MATHSLNHALLRPAIIHILRAAGFHSTKPSVLDTLTDLCARYLTLIASHTAQLVYQRTSTSDSSATTGTPGPPLLEAGDEELVRFSELDSATPTISDVRLSLTLASFFASSLTATEEAWHELLRKPLVALPAAAREKERRRRDAEDTRDVREFVDWVTGATNREMRRIAGLLKEEQNAGGLVLGGGGLVGGDILGDPANGEKEDYLSALKKKHSKTGDVARYTGTTLGNMGEERGLVRIEGGPTTLAEAVAKRKPMAAVQGQQPPSKRLNSMTEV